MNSTLNFWLAYDWDNTENSCIIDKIEQWYCKLNQPLAHPLMTLDGLNMHVYVYKNDHLNQIKAIDRSHNTYIKSKLTSNRHHHVIWTSMASWQLSLLLESFLDLIIVTILGFGP